MGHRDARGDRLAVRSPAAALGLAAAHAAGHAGAVEQGGTRPPARRNPRLLPSAALTMQLVSLALNGRFTWQHPEPGHRFDVELPIHTPSGAALLAMQQADHERMRSAQRNAFFAQHPEVMARIQAAQAAVKGAELVPRRPACVSRSPALLMSACGRHRFDHLARSQRFRRPIPMSLYLNMRTFGGRRRKRTRGDIIVGPTYS